MSDDASTPGTINVGPPHLSLPKAARIVADAFNYLGQAKLYTAEGNPVTIGSPAVREAAEQTASFVARVATDPERDNAALRWAGLAALDEPSPALTLDRVANHMLLLLDGGDGECHCLCGSCDPDEEPNTERANLALDALCRMWLSERATRARPREHTKG